MGERRLVRVGVNRFYIGEAMERDEFGLHIGGFVMPRTHADVPQSVRAGNCGVRRKLARGCIESRCGAMISLA